MKVSKQHTSSLSTAFAFAIFFAVTAISGAAHAACSYTADQVAVYVDKNFGGACQVFGVGVYSSLILDNGISSLKVGSNVRALLYENVSFQGEQALFEGGFTYSYVGSTMNDTTSSIEITVRNGTRAAAWYLGTNPSGYTSSGWTNETQGIASSPNYWFVDNDVQIRKFNINGGVTGQPLATTGIPRELSNLGCNHFGDPDYSSGFLFVPLTGCSGGPRLAAFNPSNLSLIAFDYLYNQPSAAGWVAINPITGDAYSSNSDYDSANNPIFVYEVDYSQIKRNPDNTVSQNWFLWDRPAVQLKRYAPFVEQTLPTMQGGVFSSDGKLFYLNYGYYDCGGDGDDAGIRIYDTSNWNFVARSGNAYGPFNYEHHCGSPEPAQEPEGLDYRDLSGISGAYPGVLQAVMNDNSLTAPSLSSDAFYLKHYGF